MFDRQIWRGLFSAALVALAVALAPASGFAFPQSTETSGEIVPNLSGTWLVVNRLEFSKPTPAPSPGASPAASPAAAIRNFSVAYVFTIDHVGTAEATKLRDADKALKQAAVDKANKILAEELKKNGAEAKAPAEGGTALEPKVLTYSIPRPPESVADQQDEIGLKLLDVDLPKNIQDSIDKANKEEKVWDPTDKDIAQLKSSWKTLKPKAKGEYSRIQWKIMQDKYLDGGMLQDEKTKNAKFVISGDAALIAGPGQANRTILVYGADEVSDRVIQGGHVRAIMTSSPFPIPIDMKGTFKMVRITDPSPEAKKKDK